MPGGGFCGGADAGGVAVRAGTGPVGGVAVRAGTGAVGGGVGARGNGPDSVSTGTGPRAAAAPGAIGLGRDACDGAGFGMPPLGGGIVGGFAIPVGGVGIAGFAIPVGGVGIAGLAIPVGGVGIAGGF